ncbi:NAD-binding protein [Staphylococcus epidermidis]|uniref:NAD-binding protein n=1 Tax=Staphylococcus epidermidis TaxID=1282 RepID=UPI0011A95E45|nr:NAD-binding protein [Staphylococcus epidermidis]
MFGNFGRDVRIVEGGDGMMRNEDEEIGNVIVKDLEDKGVSIKSNSRSIAF